ncbi:MAG: hypothetical protein PVSMB1_13920 [Gemmatimonadaceae bacterium]
MHIISLAIAAVVGVTITAQRVPQNLTEVAHPGGKISGARRLALVKVQRSDECRERQGPYTTGLIGPKLDHRFNYTRANSDVGAFEVIVDMQQFRMLRQPV